MPLFKRREEQPPEATAAPPAWERSLCEEEIRAELGVEVWRAGRYGRPLSVLCVVPQLLVGEALVAGELEAVAAAVRRQLRLSDRLGTLADGRLVAVLPETDGAGARVLAQRVAMDLAVRSAGLHRRNWLGGSSTCPEDGTDKATLIEAASRAALERGGH